MEEVWLLKLLNGTSFQIRMVRWFLGRTGQALHTTGDKSEHGATRVTREMNKNGSERVDMTFNHYQMLRRRGGAHPRRPTTRRTRMNKVSSLLG